MKSEVSNADKGLTENIIGELMQQNVILLWKK